MMDEFAAESHQKVLAAREAGHYGEIEPLIDGKGTVYREDDGVRTDSTPERLGKLRPVFDKTYGSVTAGNSSQVTDGAAMLILASEQAVDRHNLKPLGAIVDSQWSALDPSEMGLGPVHAITPMLQRNGLGLGDLDALEINEAFAAQALGCLAAWESDAYCRDKLGLDQAFGKMDRSKFNVDGGAIALGHPLACTGTKLTVQILNELRLRKKKYGIVSACVGGGQGVAGIYELLN